MVSAVEPLIQAGKTLFMAQLSRFGATKALFPGKAFPRPISNPDSFIFLEIRDFINLCTKRNFPFHGEDR
jgi:hypothetical protein